MGKEIPWEIREEAEQLYIIEGKTFDEVSELTGVSVAQLQRWGTGNPEEEILSWSERKKEYRTTLSNIQRDTVQLRKHMMRQALSSLNPQDLYAVIKLETMAARQDKKEEQTVRVDRPSLFLEDMEFVAKILKEVDPEGLKVFAENFDVIIEKFKEQHAETA